MSEGGDRPQTREVVRVVAADEITRVSELRALVDGMRLALRDRRTAIVPPRSLVLREDPFAAFVAMPAYSEQDGVFLTKVGTVIPAAGPGRSVHALVVVMSTRDGKPLAVLDGIAITNLKCAAVTALVTDLCAPLDAATLAVIGSGVQARENVRGVAAVRRIREVRVHSRQVENVERFITDNRSLAPDARWIACRSPEEAVEGAAIVGTATTSTTPVVRSEALGHRGLHVNCMGAHTPHSRELSTAVLEESTLIVEDVPLAVAEAGETHARALSLGELVHRDPAELRGSRTVFSSTGHAFLDLLTSVHVIERLGSTEP